MGSRRGEIGGLGLALALVSTLVYAPARAEAEGRGQTVFFGMNLGAGVARIDQPGLALDPRLGLEYDAVFGLGLTRRWAAGIELATWQPPNLDGNPSHIHLFAWRLEYTFGEKDGLMAATSLGLGLGDGSKSKRIGSGAGLMVGYRAAISPLVTLSVEGGGHGVVYTDGTALAPFVAVGLRFYGRSSF